MSLADLLIATHALGLKGDAITEANKMLNGGKESPKQTTIVKDLLKVEDHVCEEPGFDAELGDECAACQQGKGDE